MHFQFKKYVRMGKWIINLCIKSQWFILWGSWICSISNFCFLLQLGLVSDFSDPFFNSNSQIHPKYWHILHVWNCLCLSHITFTYTLIHPVFFLFFGCRFVLPFVQFLPELISVTYTVIFHPASCCSCVWSWPHDPFLTFLSRSLSPQMSPAWRWTVWNTSLRPWPAIRTLCRKATVHTHMLQTCSDQTHVTDSTRVGTPVCACVCLTFFFFF